jgi:hypothetical protein
MRDKAFLDMASIEAALLKALTDPSQRPRRPRSIVRPRPSWWPLP